MFRDPPLKIESGSMENQACLNLSVKILRVLAYLITFVIVLGGGVIAKGAVLFMTAQLRRDRKLQYCNKDLVSLPTMEPHPFPISFAPSHSQGRDKTFISTLPEEERVAWMWALLIVFSIPEFGAFIRAARICFFKSWKPPSKSHFLLIFLMETFHTLGVALLMFVVLPELDSVKAAMVTNCLCCIPGKFDLVALTRPGLDSPPSQGSWAYYHEPQRKAVASSNALST